MAQTSPLPGTMILSEIAQQITALLRAPGINPLAPLLESLPAHVLPFASALDLVESFQLWQLSPVAASRFEKGRDNLKTLAKPTKSWHHQIKFGFALNPLLAPLFGKQGLAYARSSFSNNQWEVDEIAVSLIAHNIDKAIEWADQNVSDDKLAHLLMAPMYQIEALWFVENGGTGGGDILIVTAPADFPYQPEPFHLIDSDTFLEALGKREAAVGLKV